MDDVTRLEFQLNSLTFSALRLALQLLEQQVMFSQSLSHFLRHVKGRPQTTQTFSGKFAFDGFFSTFPFL